MKKVSLFVLALLVVLFCVQPVFAAVNQKAYARAESRARQIANGLSSMAKSIMKNNKHAFEHTLTLKERQETDEYGEPGILPPMKEKVWAKDKTIAVGREFLEYPDLRVAFLIETRDTKMSFAGIHAGSTISELEKFLGATINQLKGMPGNMNITVKKGEITFPLLDPNVSMRVELLSIYHNGKRITKLEWEDCYIAGVRSSKTKAFTATATTDIKK